RFPNHRVAVLHSGLTAAQRHHQWSLVARGEADIVLGARSAVFAPVPDDRLGLIIVDEEHDGSYKQDQTPRYHGRDVAIRRAQLANCPVILGSATPSLESWHNAVERESYALHRMTDRIPGMKLPKVIVVDYLKEKREHARDDKTDRHVNLIGTTLQHAIAQTLDRNGQILLLLNRRGYANYIACPSSSCGWVMQCEHCDVTTVYHVNRSLPAGGYVQCHHCLSEQKLPSECPLCGKKVVPFGLGTQRVEEELTRKFPSLISDKTMLRVDSDTMRTARDYHDALHRFGQGEIKLLVGTQMIAKGLDYPGVRLVGVINADTALNLPDFRATERTFQLVNQVAGRCGRSADIGVAIVQTFTPESPAIQLAAAHDFTSFAELELSQRKRAQLPPYSRMARIVVRDQDHALANGYARELAEKLHFVIERTKSEASETLAAKSARASETPSSTTTSHIRLLGPAPCPISRVADYFRVQIELFAPSAATLHQFLTVVRREGLLSSSSSAITVDVDPIALL
ncbi:MAG TPA: primosomal protein N', partial [Phycisphaerales bacterium]|nr:primosomal protein N' [Phycisphaerales bacterium]